MRLTAHLIRLGMVLVFLSANFSFAGLRWCALGADTAIEASCCQAPESSQDESACCCTELDIHCTPTLEQRVLEVTLAEPEGEFADSATLAPSPGAPATDSAPPLRRYLRDCALLL